MINEEKNNNINFGSATYLPFSENCLVPKFLANKNAVNVFINLIKESHFGSSEKPISEILSSLSGLTEEQKKQAIQAAEALEAKPARKKLECQF